MTFKQVDNMIRSIGLPYGYYQLPDTEQEPPFICFYYSGDNDVKADSENYQKVEQLVIELYAPEKDFEHEAAIESALKSAGLVWSRDEVYIGSERLYQSVYTTDVLIQEATNNG